MNRTDRYRLEALIELAKSYPLTLSAIDIAAARGLPAPYLSRLLADLGRSGWLHSRRGPGGGAALARPPDSIAVAEIMSPPPRPSDLPPALDRLADAVDDAVNHCTERITLADLVRWEHEVGVTDYSI